MDQQIVVYKPSEKIKMEVKTDGETVWLTQEQMCQLFGRERSVITKHVRNIFKEGELDVKCNVQNLHIANSDKPVKFYNLDVIISVGYRVKSIAGTRFRQWATRVLRELLLNRLDEIKRIGKLERRVDSIEQDVKQIKGGVTYLIEQISAPQEPPRRRIGFCVEHDDAPGKPYGSAAMLAQNAQLGQL